MRAPPPSVQQQQQEEREEVVNATMLRLVAGVWGAFVRALRGKWEVVEEELLACTARGAPPPAPALVPCSALRGGGASRSRPIP